MGTNKDSIALGHKEDGGEREEDRDNVDYLNQAVSKVSFAE